ncbi:hypothetical protein MUP29_01095 [bacterium]|nr:hypothetical protein [bacterium]
MQNLWNTVLPPILHIENLFHYMEIIAGSPKLVKGADKILLITVAYGNIAGDGLMKFRGGNPLAVGSLPGQGYTHL